MDKGVVGSIATPSDDFWYYDMSDWYPSIQQQEQSLDRVRDMVKKKERSYKTSVSLNDIYKLPPKMSAEEYHGK